MIVTLSVNSSLDKTVELSSKLVPGEVHRIVATHTDLGGKGINVARVAQEAGHEVRCLLPAAPGDVILQLLEEARLPYRRTPSSEPVRTNLTVTDAQKETTKINEPGPELSREQAEDILTALEEEVSSLQAEDWVVLAGSLPRGLPDDFYVTCLRLLSTRDIQVAVDTSGAPLAAVGAALGQVKVDLMKPNSFELADLLGGDGAALEQSALEGNCLPVAYKAKELHERGVSTVLASMGPAGAVLVSKGNVWYGTSPDVEVLSTVGAGDSFLTGFILAQTRGLSPEAALAQALAYGAAACAKEGTQPPRPDEIKPELAEITQLNL